MKNIIKVAIFSLFLSIEATKYNPVVIVHGVLSNAKNLEPVVEMINEAHHDTYVKNVEVGADLKSLRNLNEQTALLYSILKSDEKLKDGFHLLCHSQGTIIGRTLIEKYGDPKVLNYISWGGPQAGQFGMPGHIDESFSWIDKLEDDIHKFMYSSWVQKRLSIAQIWKDSTHKDEYLRKNIFLPKLNNEVDHAAAQLYRDRILRLQNMVLVQSTKETIIEPAAACHFGFYAEGSQDPDNIVPLYESKNYQEDRLGFSTLAESGRLHLKWADCSHTDYRSDRENFEKNTLPFLD